MKLFHDKGVGQLFAAAVALAGIFPVLNLYLVYPKYQEQVLGMVQHEARKVARHLSRMATVEAGSLQIGLSHEGEPFLLQDFELIKMKVFDREGTVIYSTEAKDLGVTNTHDYFREVVARGQEFTKVVAKTEKTSEGETISRDVVETYLPIMVNNSFAGAFELYYDITDHRAEFNRIYISSLLYPLPLMLIFIGLVGYILKRLDTKNAEQRRDQQEIETQRNTLLIEREKQRELLTFVEKAKRQWEVTMDRVDDMVILTGTELRIQRCNRAVQVFSGLSFAEILSQRLPDLFSGLEMEQGNDDGRSFDYYHDASQRWFSVAIYHADLGSGDADGLVITLHDMTERKTITAELEQKNQEILLTSQELQHAIDQISAYIQRVITKEDFEFSFTYDFPEKCSSVMGCKQTDCPCYGAEAGSCWNEAGTFCGGQTQGGFAQKYGSCRQCPYFKRMTANPINLIGEQFNNMMYMLAGKNKELKAAYAELKQAQSHLLQQEKMASIGQLAAGVAHEINNPVGFITSNLNSLHKYSGRLAEFLALEAELIRQVGNEELSAQQAEGKKKYKVDYILSDINDLIRESLDGCDRVKKIVQDLKSFSRVDQATRQTVDIHECLDTTINMVRNEIKYKAKVEKDYQARTPITCFPQQLNQVFMNLLVNAAHAIDKEGVVTIKTWQDEETLCVAITDTGCGIAPENVGRIFEPFFTTKEVGKGTGLGLSIVYDIVTKNHHGDITVDSQLGQGTTFTVKIPFGKEG